MQAAGLSVVEVAAQMSNQDALMDYLGRGRRASTLRQRIIDWKKASRLFMLSWNRLWPSGLAHFFGLLSDDCQATSE